MSLTTQNDFGPSLTNVAYLGRQTAKYGLIILAVLIVGRYFLNAFVAYWKATHPEPPPPPTVGFGKLPALDFPKQDNADRPKSYRLEITTRELPEFSDRAKVFLMPKSEPSLLADERVKEIASIYSFIFEPEVLDTRTYRWTKSQPLETSLEMDIQTLAFKLRSDYLSRPELITAKSTLPENYEAVERIKQFLNTAELLGDDMATVAGRVTYLKSLGGELEEAFSLSDADFLRIDIDRLPIDDIYEMISQEGRKGVVSAIITGSTTKNASIVEMDYHYRHVDYSQVETYPIRSTKLAWKMLQAGECYVINKGKKDEATIRKVRLGYYESWSEQEYLQPVYIFEGDDDFLAVVTAIDGKYLASGSQY
ncbi:MAG: hypothetical protein ACOZAN_00520 [Patescibacteria group bacterium]